MKKTLKKQLSIKPMPRMLMRKLAKFKDQRGFRVMPFTTGDLCWLYGTTNKTLRKKIALFSKELGVRMGNYYNPRQVLIIFENLGDPPGRGWFEG